MNQGCFTDQKNQMDEKKFFFGRNNTLVLNPFSWSLRRREMFERCPREYFWHSYGAVGGAFLKIGSRQAELLHLLRSTIPLSEYVKRLLYSTMRELFISGAREPGNFRSMLEERFLGEYRDMLLGKPEYDHKIPLILEMTQEGFSPLSLKEKVLDTLGKEAELLEKYALKQLLDVSAEKRFELPFPLKICWSELDTYCTVIAAWLDSGHFNALCTGSPSEENSALLNFYALNQLGCDPGNVTVRHLENGRVYEAPGLLSFSGAFRRIRNDVDKMLELESRSGGTDTAFFPQNCNNCTHCRFRMYCTQE